jgi:hypothetical protein
MVVSRFSKTPTQKTFSEIDRTGPSAASRAGEPSGVGGYMRKRDLEVKNQIGALRPKSANNASGPRLSTSTF